MTLEQRMDADLKDAMRARDSARTDCLRMIRAELKKKSLALREKDGVEHELTDEQATEVVAAYAKQRRDSIAAYRDAGRDEMAAKEEAELAIVTSYLPEQLGADELASLVADAVAESGAAGPQDMGKVMKVLMPKVKGRADGKAVSAAVKAALAG